MRRTAFAFLLVVAAVGWGCLATATQELPPTTTYRVEGLSAPAEILVDRWGVPHLYAESIDDVFFLQGLNAARDRLWQLDFWRRRGLGQLSDALGPAFVEQDRAARLFLYRGDMYSEWLAYGSDAKRIATAFTAGINAWVRLVRSQPELLPWEFEYLGYQPALWSPTDVVRIRSHGLVRNVSREVRRALFVRRFGLEADAIRAPLEPTWETTVPEGLDLDLISDEVLQVYRLATGNVRLTPETLPTVSAEADDDSVGSNNWAISPRLTASGRPILANDPHRRQSLPSLRYIAHLVAPGMNVIGAGEPALPGISIGHNERIAFGLTIFAIDQEDLYVYRTRPGQPDEYRYQDRWEPMGTVLDTIAVRGEAPRPVELKFTRHGPVIFEDASRQAAFAVRAAWLEPGMAPYFGSIDYMRASNWDEFLAAMNRWGAPSENQVYADIEGNIGWKPAGRAPIRPNWDGLMPVPGDGRYEWAGFWDMDQLPVEYNPERGWVGTANEMNLPADFPYAERKLGFEWSNPARMQRIRQVLSEASDVTLADMLRLQTDHVSVPAQRLRPRWQQLSSDDPRIAAALDLLSDWDLVMDNDSAAAALFLHWLRLLRQELLPRVLPAEAADALEMLNERVALEVAENPAKWLRSDGAAQLDAVLLASLGKAVEALESELGRDPAGWRFGAFNRMGLRHPLSEVVDDATRERIDIAPEEKCPVDYTVGENDASWRQILDVGNWDASVAMSNPGQSGDPDSPFYRNLWGPWKRCETFPLLYSRDKIEAASQLRIRVLPGSGEPE